MHKQVHEISSYLLNFYFLIYIYIWFAVTHVCIYTCQVEFVLSEILSCYIFYYREVAFRNPGDFSFQELSYALVLTTTWAESRQSARTTTLAYRIVLFVSYSLERSVIKSQVQFSHYWHGVTWLGYISHVWLRFPFPTQRDVHTKQPGRYMG